MPKTHLIYLHTPYIITDYLHSSESSDMRKIENSIFIILRYLCFYSVLKDLERQLLSAHIPSHNGYQEECLQL